MPTSFPSLLAPFLLAFVLSSAAAAELLPHKPGTYTVRFSESAVQSGADEVKWRLHSVEDPGSFDIAKEQFQLVIPESYRADEPWGLFIWVSANDAASLPADWLSVLASHKLLFVGALHAGNPRNIFDRVRMAVDANVAMRKQFRIDGRRVYVSGFSGGARVASMLGVAFADLFTGAIPFMAVNFYTELPLPDGKTLGVSFIPDDDVLEIAKKKCRYVLVTGEKDFNRTEVHSADENGFRKEGFTSVRCLEVPGVGHAMPPAKWLQQGLEFLDASPTR
jgi:hypothetical protein